MWAIDGALLFVHGNVVQRLDDKGTLTPIGKIPKDNAIAGEPNRIYDLAGSYPDSVDVFYRTDGRSPMPTYAPLTGKGKTVLGGVYGSNGFLRSARIGESTLVASWGQMTPFKLETARGPKLVRNFQSRATCKPSGTGPQILPVVMESTANGRLVSIGDVATRKSRRRSGIPTRQRRTSST